jgi:hypothetical protein
VTWQRQAIRFAGRAAAREAATRLRGEPKFVHDVFRVDPDWRRIEDGHAARLDARTTIDVAKPVGRWAAVDPLAANEAWRSPWKAVGLGVWLAAVGTSTWLGWRRGRGPLAALRREDDVWG